MKKKLLVVMLALALVLAFSSVAMAYASFSVAPQVDSKYAAAIVFDHTDTTGANPIDCYNVYTNANQVTLSFTVNTGYNFYKGNSTDPTAVRTDTLNGNGDSEYFHVSPIDETSTEAPVYVKYTMVSVAPTIDKENLYKASAATPTFGKDANGFLVPAGLSEVYVKITPPADVNYTVDGADMPDANGFAKVTINDMTESFTVAVKIDGKTFASEQFTLQRPTLKYVYFNDRGSGTGNRLTINSGKYAYQTDNGYVESGWSPVYLRPVPLSAKAAITAVKEGTRDLSKNDDWYYQRMNKDVYELTVTVSVGSGDDAIKQDYTIYLMDEDYIGPTVKTFAANELSTGRGDEYLTVVDEEGRTIYIFLPYDETVFYAHVTVNGEARTLKLNSTTITENTWNPAGTSTNKLTIRDYAGLEYYYNINVIQGSKNYHDASLKSLTIKSGTRANTASEVDIDFDPEVTEYAFPVTDRDVWLNIAAKANDSKARIFINNQETTSLTEKKLDTDAMTEYKILVVAGDGVTTETYTVTVNGSTGLLQSLSVSNIVGLTPYFAPEVNTYTAYTEPTTISTNIVALAKNYSSDYIQISQANFNEYGQVKSYSSLTRAVAGGTSCTGELKTGANIFRVDVLPSANASSAKASYYLTIYVPAANPKCVVSSQKLYVNGKAQTLSAYNIAGNNYLKLRDVAALLDGTVKEMNVDWDASKWTASMVMPGTFVRSGGELIDLTPPKKYELSTQYFTYNAKPVFPLAYNVTGTGDAAGYNYVMLRDVASLLDFGVTYNPTSQTVNIDTASEYTPGL